MTNAIVEFNQTINPKLKEKLGLKNALDVPRLEKIVINVGIGKFRDVQNYKEKIVENIATITGQKPKITKAKKAISGFKVRENDEVSVTVTLRGKRMYDFAYKLANIVLPRVRDFRGLDEKCFDKNGNYTLAVKEQIIFPEISYEKASTMHGMSITIKTTAENIKEGRELLEALGFPFKKLGN